MSDNHHNHSTSSHDETNQLIREILNSVTVIRAAAQVVERRLASGTEVTPTYLTSAMSHIQELSDDIAADVRLLATVG